MLGKPIKNYSSNIDVFIGDCNHPEHDGCIFILSDVYDESLIENIYYKDMYQVGTKFMYVFNVPEKYKCDYIKFQHGDYTQFSEEYKAVLLNFVPKSTNIKKILYPSIEDFKSLERRLGTTLYKKEIYSSPNMEEEIYK